MNINDLLKTGIECYKAKDYETALLAFNSAISVNPNLASAYHYCGSIYLALNQKENAIKNFRKAEAILKDKEYSKLCNKLEEILVELFPSKTLDCPENHNNDALDFREYQNLFWIDEDGNWYDDPPDHDLYVGYDSDANDYYCDLLSKLTSIKDYLFSRLKKIQTLELKRSQNSEFDRKKLLSQNLPLCSSHLDIARLMGFSVGYLRCLAFSRNKYHYQSFEIPKKIGGKRKISAPNQMLKKAQKWIQNNILDKIKVHDAAHGFKIEHSILTNARPHVNQDIIISFDLKDFFPTISYRRVKKLFKSLGYSETASIVFGLLCTEPIIKNIELDGQAYELVCWTKRCLPQGAPSSPGITNLLCCNLDQRLSQMANKYGFIYTRYADDLSFSASGESLDYITNIFKGVRSIVRSEGFTLHESKTRVMRKHQQQKITGIVVNQKLNISRKTLKRFRALLYQIEQEGFFGKHWGHYRNYDLLRFIEGFSNFVYMVNPDKGVLFVEQVKRIKEKHPVNINKISQSSIITLIYSEFQRIDCSPSTRRKYLKETYGKQSLQDLTEENLLELLDHLKSTEAVYSLTNKEINYFVNINDPTSISKEDLF
ncbi:reverse transcriptase domain-containing protein [Roseofilum sp. Guam]|uniref:reverse transcriptase domain-containing protein n=1 Tax=Roseofilum sp. Guam TaxID=2821502 RepID=UPI001B2455EE|nr:reverse transcriptase domain-containing protein [Roseofilum sp. Guam]MBP0030484.1 hypothetical protein [Roseofilum sp. Guam]